MPHGFVMGLERVVLVVVVLVWSMPVAVVKIVDMVFVLNGRGTAA
jgi:hypothetical protein